MTVRGKLALAAAVATMLLGGCSGDDPAAAPLACAIVEAPIRSPIHEQTEIPCSERRDPRVSEQMSDEGIRLTSQLGLAAGRYALPTSPPAS